MTKIYAIVVVYFDQRKSHFQRKKELKRLESIIYLRTKFYMFMLILLWDVVYFDQRLGVAHSKCWSKYTTYSIVTFK